MKGEVIGVTAAQLTGGQNLNFAIPIDCILPLLSYSSPKPLAQYSTTDRNASTNAPATPSQNKESLAPWLDAPILPVRWEMKERNGEFYGIAERVNQACLELAKEQTNNPSPYWNPLCSLGATIIKGPVDSGGLIVYNLHVSIAPLYRDSERVDMRVTVQQPDHTFYTYVRNDVPIVLRGRVLEASADLMLPYDPASVPTVEATEKGGKREATHSYW
jgi:hypothetical protein